MINDYLNTKMTVFMEDTWSEIVTPLHVKDSLLNLRFRSKHPRPTQPEKSDNRTKFYLHGKAVLLENSSKAA